MTPDFAIPPRTGRGVPLLVTVDVEIAHDRDVALQRGTRPPGERVGCTAGDLVLHRRGCRGYFSRPLRALARRGHAIGRHGLDHGAWEDYRRLDRQTAGAALRAATDRIERALGVRPVLFRGPRMTTSAATQDVLVGLGYLADFSVSAHRFDPFAASAYQIQWLRVPPTPYRPSIANPFRPGHQSLVVVPLSGYGAPFVSGILYIVGQQAMRRFVGSLAARAARAEAPLVYIYHSYEFTGLATADYRPWHHRLYRRDPEERYRLNAALLRWLVGDLGLEASSAAQYLSARGARYGYEGGPHRRHSPPPCGMTMLPLWRSRRPLAYTAAAAGISRMGRALRQRHRGAGARAAHAAISHTLRQRPLLDALRPLLVQ